MEAEDAVSLWPVTKLPLPLTVARRAQLCPSASHMPIFSKRSESETRLPDHYLSNLSLPITAGTVPSDRKLWLPHLRNGS